MAKRDICIDRLQKRSKEHGDDNAYHTFHQDRFVPITWSSFHEQVQNFARSLIALDVKSESKVAILGFNRLEWVISAIGAQYAGCVSVGIYTQSSKEEVAYVVDHCDAEILVVENIERYRDQVETITGSSANIKLIVLMSKEDHPDARVIGFDEFLALGKSISDEALQKRQAFIESDSLATMIYTSGTTGHPKAVMLSHQSIAWTVRTVVQTWRCGPWDSAVSYLPLAHVAEQMFTLYAPIECGMQQYFTPSFEALKETLSLVSPTVFFGVPRVYEKMYDAVSRKVREESPLKQRMLKHLQKLTLNYYEATNMGRMPNIWINSQYQMLAKKVFKRIRDKIGFSRARICISGAAPISKDIISFFCSLDIPIYEVYGQSESSGPATCNFINQAKIGSVGRAIPGSEVRIAPDGEVLLKGPHVFSGYYKDRVATDEVLKDGWLYTGDIGNVDLDGFLRITDRKKDLLITAGGKNISPQNLEALLKNLPHVQSAVVVGDAKKYLCALLSPDLESVRKRAVELGKSLENAASLVSQREVLEEIQNGVEKINIKLAPVEQIKRFSLLPNEFSIDTGELTPTMKIKRKFVNQKYQSEIEKMYQ